MWWLIWYVSVITRTHLHKSSPSTSVPSQIVPRRLLLLSAWIYIHMGWGQKKACVVGFQQVHKCTSNIHNPDYRQTRLFSGVWPNVCKHAVHFSKEMRKNSSQDSSACFLPSAACRCLLQKVSCYVLFTHDKGVVEQNKDPDHYSATLIWVRVLFSTSHRLILPQACMKVSSSKRSHWLAGPELPPLCRDWSDFRAGQRQCLRFQCQSAAVRF